MKSAYRWALLATIATYLLIFTGGLVRVSGSGLGCPDWPRCFGRWIPPTNVSQLPPDVDPDQFNFTLAWIEYLNRLFGVLVGFLILITALLAVRHFARHNRVIIPCILAALLVAYTGWQGGQVVKSELSSRLVSIHALFAILIAALMLYATQQIHYRLNPQAGTAKGEERAPRAMLRFRRWSGILLLAFFIQILLGTNLRSTIEAFLQSEPLSAGSAWMRSAGMINQLHMALGVLIIVVGIYWNARILRRSQQWSEALESTAWASLILLPAQLILGLLAALAPSALWQVLHLWGASLAAGVLLLQFVAVRRKIGFGSAAADGLRAYGGFHAEN